MIVDLIILALAVAVAVWGYSQGVSVGVLVFFGFGSGAVLGSRVAPLALDGGLRDPFAPVIALPAALLFGVLLAGALERLGRGLRRRLRRHRTLDALGGALVAACLGLVTVWMAAAIPAGADSLKEPLRDSKIVAQLNSVLLPPGPLLSAKAPSSASPVNKGPIGRAGLLDPRIKQDPQVRAAARSVAKVEVCDGQGTGTGWIAGEGIVVTNAHIVEGSDAPGVRIEGLGKAYRSEPIWYDDDDDVAVLRVPALKGAPALPIARRPRVGTTAAVLGFPFSGRYKAREARLGATISPPKEAQRGFFRGHRRITSLLARLGTGPGSSGSPVIDRNGRVVAMIFASIANGGRFKFAVPSPIIREALSRALVSPHRVDTGDCSDE